MEIQKRVKAYIVETDDPEEATVQFATTNVAARRQGADTIGTDFGYVSCKRLPWADLYAEDRVIPESAFIANGWRYECATCGDSVDSYTESPVFALNLVFCCEACHDAGVEDRKAEAARKQELIDAVQAKYPGAVVTYASGHETRRNVSFRFPGGQGPVDWELGSETALIYRDDLNAWNAWRGLQPAYGGDLCAEGAAGD